MNKNTYAENMAALTKSTAEIVEIMDGINETMTGNDVEVVVNDDITLPSYANVVKRLERAENTVATFTQGSGLVETSDNTFRKVKVMTISRPPEDIAFNGTNGTINNFTINPNWFFESFQYPRCVVKIDLTNKVDDDSDRVYVNRIIINSNQTTTKSEQSVLALCQANITPSMSYADVVNFLNTYEIEFEEDKDEVKFPLTFEKYSGKFAIKSISLIKNASGISEAWYYLDGVNYYEVDENDDTLDNGHLLMIGDYLRYENSLYKIADINQVEKRVRLDYAVGYETLSANDVLEFYNEPFSEKVIEVGIGIDEFNAIFVKGVNENYNLLSREWSNPVVFYSNNLTLEGGTETDTFKKYFNENVADFSREMISKAKENRKYAYYGTIPNAPVVDKDNLRVVQINTQLEAVLDSDEYNSLSQETQSVKSQMAAYRYALKRLKDQLLNTTDSSARIELESNISSATNSLNTSSAQFESNVNTLNSMLNTAGAVTYSPKYHIRGFFQIPDSSNGERIIGFETLYRYIHTDNTGAKLETYDCTVSDTLKESIAFTDWNLSTSKFLIKKYNSETGEFVWSSDFNEDTSEIRINQIDIPIQVGENVELKVRSVSEAGYPFNPLKSEWSNSVIMTFPSNLSANDSATAILESVKSDVNSVTLQNTLYSAGLYSHIADTNSQFKHDAANIGYVDASTNSTVTMSLQKKIEELEKRINSLTS